MEEKTNYKMNEIKVIKEAPIFTYIGRFTRIDLYIDQIKSSDIGGKWVLDDRDWTGNTNTNTVIITITKAYEDDTGCLLVQNVETYYKKDKHNRECSLYWIQYR